MWYSKARYKNTEEELIDSEKNFPLQREFEEYTYKELGYAV